MSKRKFIFPFDWRVETMEFDEEGENGPRASQATFFRIYGFAHPTHETMCLVIRDFHPYAYVELPSSREWCAESARGVQDAWEQKLCRADCLPVRAEFVLRSRIFFAEGRVVKGHFRRNKYPMFKVYFSTVGQMQEFRRKTTFRPLDVGNDKVKLVMHQESITPLMQFTTAAGISTTGWVSYRPGLTEFSLTDLPREHWASWESVRQARLGTLQYPTPRLLSFDIECYSHNPNKMPTAEVPADKCFQISMVLNGAQGEDKHLLSLGSPRELEGITVHRFPTEADLLLGFTQFIVDHDPQIIMGYNIFSFDIPYLIARAELLQVLLEFSSFSHKYDTPAEKIEIRWESAAYGEQKFDYLAAEGRLFVDMLPIIRRDFKFSTYKLKFVADQLIGDTKDPMDHHAIFRAYIQGVAKAAGKPNRAARVLAKCGKYCVQDSSLVIRLFEVTQTWMGISEMANVTRVPIFDTFTTGQQIKVLSQLFHECTAADIVIDASPFRPAMGYKGATVFPPVAGVYQMVIPMDFKSLYPSVIRAYNICYTSYVPPGSHIQDSLCHIVAWEDEEGSHSHRFLKEPKGMLPLMLEKLADARDAAKAVMKRVKGELTDATGDVLKRLKSELKVYDKKQLALKVSANSAYGFLGVIRGRMPFPPGAASVTAMGRKSVEKAATHLVDRYGANLVYGDTDSCMVNFDRFSYDAAGAKGLWAFALQIEEEIRTEFPDEIVLEFEETIYAKFLILTKKRYLAYQMDENGVVSTELQKKGVMLTRRDYCPFQRTLYEAIVRKVFEGESEAAVEEHVIEQINLLLSGSFSRDEFVQTMAVGSISSYALKPLPQNPEKRVKRLQDLGIAPYDCADDCSPTEFCVMCRLHYIGFTLPAQVQLAERMRRRGVPVEAGERLEMLYTTAGGLKGKASQKAEHPAYLKAHSDYVKVDYYFYLKSLEKQFTQLMNAGYHHYSEKGEIVVWPFFKEHIKLRFAKLKVLNQLKGLVGNTYRYVDEDDMDVTKQRITKRKQVDQALALLKPPGAKSEMQTLFEAAADESWLAIDLPVLRSVFDCVFQRGGLCPRREDIFNVFKWPLASYRVVIITGECYTKMRGGNPVAQGLALSDAPGQRVSDGFTPGLRDIFRESGSVLRDGSLLPWVEQGVMLLCSSLTGAKNKKMEHLKYWDAWTTQLVSKISRAAKRRMIFLLWGEVARGKKDVIGKKHVVMELRTNQETTDPFFGNALTGCQHFSETNSVLSRWREAEIVW